MPAADPGAGKPTYVWTNRVRFVDPLPTSAPYRGFNLAEHVGDALRAVQARRAELARQLGLDAPIVFMQQVHEADVTVLDAHPGEVMVPNTDALVTVGSGIPIAVLVADCVPLVIYEPRREVLSVVHAGRRGVMANIVENTIQEIAQLGVAPSELRAVIGPAIGACCYEVPAALQDEVCRVVPEARARTRWGAPSLNLVSAVGAQLRRAGVVSIALESPCSYEAPEYYSYRRDRVTGRFAAVCYFRS